jgi:hypothetical protein
MVEKDLNILTIVSRPLTNHETVPLPLLDYTSPHDETELVLSGSGPASPLTLSGRDLLIIQWTADDPKAALTLGRSAHVRGKVPSR